MAKHGRAGVGDLADLQNFLREHHVMCLATGDPEGSHSAPLFYASAENGAALIFLSDPASRHGRNLAADPRASAGVYRETADITDVRGVQLRGTVERFRAGSDAESEARRVYLGRFPDAAPLLRERPATAWYRYWILHAKLTDNRRGFGFKQRFEPSGPTGGPETGVRT